MKNPRLHHPFILLLAFASLLSFANAANFSRVILDPGHGGKDKGAVWGGICESNLNLKVARKVENLLKARGIPVTMTRRSDQFISLSKRATISNNYCNAIFVSIHFNASTHTSVRGVETYYASAKGKQLAQQIHSRMVKKLNLRDRKTRLGSKYAVLNKTNCPAILVECGYISNPYERKRCAASWYQSLCARAIVDGIVAYR